MRIALFSDTYYPQVNGVARTLKRLTDYWQSRGIEHLIFTPKFNEESIYCDLVRPVNSVPFFLYPECRLALPNLTSIYAELDRFQPDLLHLATPFNVGLSGLRYAKLRSIPHVASYHTHFDRYLDYYRMKMAVPLYWSYIRWFHQTCAATFAPSRETIDTLHRQSIQRLQLWSRGVDCQMYNPDKRTDQWRERYNIGDRMILLYVGRIAPEKDIDTLASIMQGLPSTIQDKVHWLIVGDGPLYGQLQEQAPFNVTFTGYKQGEELTQIYASADLFVFPSSTETFGNVALEAMASGLAVVGARAGGILDTVEDQQNGILCAPREAASFIQAIIELVNSPERLAQYRNVARATALDRTWHSIFDQLTSSYERIVNESSLTNENRSNIA